MSRSRIKCKKKPAPRKPLLMKQEPEVKPQQNPQINIPRTENMYAEEEKGIPHQSTRTNHKPLIYVSAIEVVLAT
jgi:hypothetical protein